MKTLKLNFAFLGLLAVICSLTFSSCEKEDMLSEAYSEPVKTEAVLFSGEVTSVAVPGVNGEFAVKSQSR